MKIKNLVRGWSAMLALLLTLTACSGGGDSATTSANTEAPATTAPNPEVIVAESGKDSDFSLVYKTSSDSAEYAKAFASELKTKLGVELTVKEDAEAASGNEIIFNSTRRPDCKELVNSLKGGYYAIRTTKSGNDIKILVAYKGDVAAKALVARLSELIDKTSGKLVIPSENFSEDKAAVTLNENKADKVIDIYLIAGQSNAAGYSHSGKHRDVYKNVWFSGEVDKIRATGKASMSLMNPVTYKKTVAPTLGRVSGNIGPEYGMAEIFNEYYDGNETPVLIFKSAAGGTALNNDTSGQSGDYGNWYPRSLWPDGKVDPKNSPTGVQYYNLVENFKLIYAKLVDDGYTPKVRGMVWMQGEADLGRHFAYKTLLKTFITDIREDIASITGDEETLEMPFIIGKIATTFGWYNNSSVPAFNKMQDDVAKEMKNVYTIETSDLIIVGEDGKIVGTDQWHFNADDAVTLGNRFAEKLLEHYTAK